MDENKEPVISKELVIWLKHMFKPVNPKPSKCSIEEIFFKSGQVDVVEFLESRYFSQNPDIKILE